MAWLTGFPREKVEWFPTIDSKKCVKCGMCLNCGRNVYDWTKDGAKVVRPYNCVVGCTTCANLCQGNAITFQDIKTIRELYKKEGIWSKVKKQLQEEEKLKISE
jgi:NAD-dependent dihydropyrimidine dehydrogenase PreA subunit